MHIGNLERNIPANLPTELIETLTKSDHIRIERIVSKGHQSPPNFWYDQPEHEFVLLHTGCAQVQFEDTNETVSLSAGDYLLIPAHRRHRVHSTCTNGHTIWLAVFFPANL